MSRGNLDFGRGFYLTSYREQAEDWARRKGFLARAKSIVNQYDVDEAFDTCRMRRFLEADAEWVEFVCSCRRGEDGWKEYDLIVGGVADDRVYYAVDMYYQGLWDMQRTLDALRFYKVNDQWCFVSQRLLDHSVRYLGHFEV
jgi:hypothetical protein